MPAPKRRRASNAAFEDDAILELIDRTEKGEPLSRICAESRMPSRRAVYDWLETDKDFASRFHAARARGVHYLAEECLAIADRKAKDAVEVADKRLQIDTRLRLAGKWLPKIYGDRVDVNYSGEVVTRHDLSAYSADDLDALEKLIRKASDASGDQGGTGAPGADRVH